MAEGTYTEPVRPRIGLHEGGSVFPMLFRWILQEVYSEVIRRWEQLGYGVVDRFSRLAWPTLQDCSPRAPRSTQR